MPKRESSSVLRDYFLAVAAAVAVALAIRFFLVEAYRIPSATMRPTLEAGDTIFVSKLDYGLRLPGSAAPFCCGRLPERGDVVLFSSPDDPAFDSIKRVVALPGDRVQVKNGLVTLNGAALSTDAPSSATCARESYPAGPGHGVCWEPPLIEDFGPETVPAKSIFVIGDLRSRGAIDSAKTRTWGMIPTASLKGKARWIWLSIEPGSSARPGPFPRFRFERMFRRIE